MMFIRVLAIATCLAAPLNVAAWGAEAFDYKAMEKLWVLPPPTPPKDAQGRDLIRVRIYPHEHKAADKRAAEPLDKVTLEGSCQLFVGKPNEVGSTGKKIGNLKPGAAAKFNITVAKLKNPLWLECSGPVLVRRANPLVSHKYEGHFYISKATNADLPVNPHVQVVNVLAMETYLRGVVPTEVIPAWPADALKAQAVAARSYAYFNIAHNQYFPKPKIYDVDDTNHYQAYSGLTNIHVNTDGAIEATKGHVLTYQKKLFPTFFDTDAGGQTESAKEVFGLEAPYIPVKEEPKEVVEAVKPWSVTMKLADLAKGLGNKVPAGRTLKTLAVEPGDLTPGKRVRVVKVELDNGSKVAVPIADFRRAAGNLKSALFKLSVTGDSVKIDGKGAGHGVGLNQTGAKVLAKLGWGYRKILELYFKDVALCSRAGAKADVPAC